MKMKKKQKAPCHRYRTEILSELHLRPGAVVHGRYIAKAYNPSNDVIKITVTRRAKITYNGKKK